MKSVTISCPTPGTLLTTNPDIFAVPSGTMSANGTIIAEREDVAFVMVLVQSGDTATQSPGPSASAGVPAKITGMAWCIDNLNVSGTLVGSGGLSQATIYAFGCSGSGGSGQIGDPDVVPFLFEATGLTCSGCSGASGTRGPALRGTLVAAIGGASALEMTVSDGPVAGVHQVPGRGPLAWEANVAGKSIRLRPLPNHTLLLEVDATTEVAIPRFEPFSAVFSGSLFGASRSVVVTLA